MRKILFLALVSLALPACGDQVQYRGSVAEAPESPQETTPTPTPERPVFVVVPTPEDALCEVQAPLRVEDLDPENATVFPAPRVEDQVAGDGSLQGRILRGDGWQRDELYTPQGCLGILTLRTFNADGQPTREELRIFDPELAFQLSPYGGLQPGVTTWDYDQDGGLIRWSTLHGTITFERDARGNVIREVAPYGEEEMVTVRTFDRHDQLLSAEASVEGRVLWAEVWTYAGEGRPLTFDRVHESGGTANVSYDYDGDRLVRRTSTEHWQGDSRPERREVEHFDAEGRKIEFTSDQPYDGRIDWRETYEFDGEGNLVLHQARNVATGELMRNVRHTYDDQGRQTRTDYGDGRVIESSYDDADRLTGQRVLRHGELQRETRTVYHSAGAILLQETDSDGDGVVDGRLTQEVDRAGQPILTEQDWQADGTLEGSTLRLWR